MVAAETRMSHWRPSDALGTRASSFSSQAPTRNQNRTPPAWLIKRIVVSHPRWPPPCGSGAGGRDAFCPWAVLISLRISQARWTYIAFWRGLVGKGLQFFLFFFLFRDLCCVSDFRLTNQDPVEQHPDVESNLICKRRRLVFVLLFFFPFVSAILEWRQCRTTLILFHNTKKNNSRCFFLCLFVCQKGCYIIMISRLFIWCDIKQRSENQFLWQTIPTHPTHPKKKNHRKAKSKYTEAVSKKVGANCTIVLWINN